MLLNYHIGRFVFGSLCVGDLVRLGLSGVRVAGWMMSLAILFHFLCTQHLSDIDISIIRSLRLCCWITTSVVLFSVRRVLELWCGWVWVVSVLQAEWCHLLFYFTSYVLNIFRILIHPEDVEYIRSEGKIASDIKLAFHSSTITMTHGPRNMRVTEKRPKQ